MEEQHKRLEEFHQEQAAIKKNQADRHAEVKYLRQEQVKRLQVGFHGFLLTKALTAHKASQLLEAMIVCVMARG